ncbi:MAG: hypothetical protein JNM84_25135, partial [Planctomycetes bacterium]|nr:hypothetical protein [Planctomycetota bacterium]
VRIPLAIFALLGVASLPLWRRWVQSPRGCLRYAILGLARTAFYVALLALALLVEALASAAGGEDVGRRCAQLFVEASSGLRFALQNVGILVAIFALGFGDLAWIRSLEAPRAEPLRRCSRKVEPIPTARHLRALLVALLSGCVWSMAIEIAWRLLFYVHRSGWSFSLEVDPCVLLSCGLASVITWEALRRYGTPRASLGSAIRWGIAAQLARWMLWLPIDLIVFLAVEKQTVSPLDALLLANGLQLFVFDLVAILVLLPYRVFAFLALLLSLGAIEMVLFRRCFRAREERS